ncbi:unnamed protein product [Effrenium voratum]|nr:unnamed protein product [Effrenium voratum]|mmetsp:Transcript_50962/g.121943  ORF Transcript_50962/g.121943 Transcript_50962/m.121943 type:complete len:623 (+) Transcript_50962:90-1958(+)|eukprot:CAMPEP_0181452822 /NCGR_PEP_ID=MMETSP1110-20121109/29407_1 /TAXON_ID=174948 /ORGANISM="Symbiodinium sp., Strain CCMP421" /LENGTH=622 /DNA_ID=CAMNT_0023577121 /DNA_START=67 /DNA_END=1935 /DNA_ORIENTATION=-
MSSYGALPTEAGQSRATMLAEVEEGSEEEIAPPAVQESSRWNWKAVGGVAGLLVLGALVLMANPCRRAALFSANPSSGIDLAEARQLEDAAGRLKHVNSRAEADKMVASAMKQASEERLHQAAQRKEGKLPPLFRDLNSVSSGQFFQNEKLALEAKKAEALDKVARKENELENRGEYKLKESQNFRQAFCVFNAVETVDSIGGTGIDIESLIRTCPEPRNDIGTFACSTNAGTLAEMVGSAATWLSSAVSSCDVLPNVGAECGAGVAGIVSALGEIAASGSLAMTSCKEFPLAGFKQAEQYCPFGGCEGPKISQIGNTAGPARRLFIGSGIGGTGVQCGVDVGFIVDNIYDTIFFIQQGVNLNMCNKNVRFGPYSYLTGVPEAACAMDIAGAVAWITQIATFVQQLINHCPDLLNLPTLCGSSATGLVSAASQIATWGSQIAISCGEGESLTQVTRNIVFNETYSVVLGREVEFIKLCSHAMSGFAVHCNWLESEDGDGADKQLRVTFAGTYQGLLLAEADIKENGLLIPGFEPLTYDRTVRVGDRRLAVEESMEKWDPVNHPSMKRLRKKMRELYEIRQNITGGKQSWAGTQANLQERLHLIEPALQEYSADWSLSSLDQC